MAGRFLNCDCMEGMKAYQHCNQFEWAVLVTKDMSNE